MKLTEMEGRACNAELHFPGKHHKHYDVVTAIPSTGGLLLGTSSKTSRKWHGSIWFYADKAKDEDLLDPFKCSSAVAIQSGLSDVQWISETVIVAGLDTGAVASWEVNNEERAFRPLWEAREHDNLVRSVAVYNKDNRVVSAGYDGVVKIWDVEDDIGNSTRTYRAHSDIIHSLDHQLNAPMFVTTSLDGYVIVWDTRLPKPAQRHGIFAKVGPVCARWQPGTDTKLAIGDSCGQVNLVDLRNLAKENCKVLDIHKGSLCDLAFTDCGTLLATGGQDGQVLVFNTTENNKCIKSANHSDYARSVTWRSKNELISCAYDGKVLTHKITQNQDGECTGMELNGNEAESEK